MNQRLRITFDRDLAQRKLDAAQQKSNNTLWPDTAFLSDLHPVVEWLVDKVLVRLGRQQAPVLTTPRVDGPVFLVQGVYSNALGRPTVLEWMAVSGLPDQPLVRPMFDVLREAGVGPDMTNAGVRTDLAPLQELVPDAIEAARTHLDKARRRWDQAEAEVRLVDAHETRLREWEQISLLPDVTQAPRKSDVQTTIDKQRELVESLATTGEPLLRLLAVLDAAPSSLEESE